ncbi:MAG TPA: MlaD family protein [Candidatus Polarisedimenticolaceae bacterium]|nr:MlaD family protein [Candidatus Polarisedimenticolaceae bacterium]
MNVRRNEIATGLLVVATLAVVGGTLMALTAPGSLRSERKYFVYFDNAGGIQAGTDVLLAGRRVGQVTDVQSPVPLAERPPGRAELEAKIEVRVSKDAKIYRNVAVRMEPYGLLGEQKIDFTRGDEGSGIAASGTAFVGERVSGLTDAAEAATKRLAQLEVTLNNINRLTGEDSDLQKTAANAREFSDTIKREPWRLIWKKKNPKPGQTAERRTR